MRAVGRKKTKTDWLQRIVDRTERAFAKLPEPYWLKGSWPMWVENVGRELSKTYFPTAKLKVSKRWEPGEVGAMLGQEIAYLESLSSASQLAEKNVSWKQLRLTYGKDIKERVQAYERKFRGQFLPDLERAYKFALTLAIEQEYRKCSRFFAAFGRAIERRVSSTGDIGRTNTQIYVLLLIAWRSVEKLGSIPKLHEVLCKIFGNNVAGTIKRIEKICERIGLSYREISERTGEAKSPQK